MIAVDDKIKINGYKKIFTVKSINNEFIQVKEISGASFHRRICTPANQKPLFVKGQHHVLLIGEQEDEEYDEIIHNHLEVCPNCKTEFASTNAYEDLRERKSNDIEFKCERCNCIFEKVGGDWYSGLIVQAKDKNKLKYLAEGEDFLTDQLKSSTGGRPNHCQMFLEE